VEKSVLREEERMVGGNRLFFAEARERFFRIEKVPQDETLRERRKRGKRMRKGRERSVGSVRFSSNGGGSRRRRKDLLGGKLLKKGVKGGREELGK